MKYAVFFLLCCLALASAAPQYLWPGAGIITAAGIAAPIAAPLAPRTLVAGPTVVNGAGLGWGSRLIAPGYVGPAYI